MRFADEVRGIAALELLLVFKRIVPLRKGHGAGIKPAVDHNGLALHRTAALLAGEGDGVKERLVQLDVLRHAWIELAQLCAAAYNMYLTAFLANPNRLSRA